MGPRSDDCFTIVRQGNYINNILTVQQASEVAELGGGVIFVRCSSLVVQRINWEYFIVAEGVQLGVSQESGMMDRGAMVGDLDKGIVFVRYRRVVDIQQAIGAAR